MKKKRIEPIVSILTLAILALILLVACNKQIDAIRRGEAVVLKGAPVGTGANVISNPDALRLRGRGFLLSENIGSLSGPLDDKRLIGTARAHEFAVSVLSEADRVLIQKFAERDTNNPIYRDVLEVSNHVSAIRTKLEASTNYTTGISHARDRFLQQLADYRNYLSQLRSDVSYIKDWLLANGPEQSRTPDFSRPLIPRDLLIKVLDHPISYGEFTGQKLSTYRSAFDNVTTTNTRALDIWQTLDNQHQITNGTILTQLIIPRRTSQFLTHLNPALLSGAFDIDREDYTKDLWSALYPEHRIYFVDPDAIRNRIGTALKDSLFLQSTWFTENNFLSKTFPNAPTNELTFANSASDFQESAFMIAEGTFNLVEALSRRSIPGFVMWDFHSRQPKFYKWDTGLERFIKQIQVGLAVVDTLFAAASDIMKTDSDEARSLVDETEAWARQLARVTGKAHNRQLHKSSDDQKPLRLTLLLQTLFVKNLGDPIYSSTSTNPVPRGGDLLTVMRLKNHANKATAYPIIYQQNFLPDNFVNVHDRVVYGPATYDGSFMDVYFQILRAAPPSTNTDMLRSGFQSLMSKLTLVNPEFAAISPVASALFNGILDAATREQTELEVQWIIPAEEKDSSANTDSLLAETGIYIVIKTDSRFRKKVPPAATRLLYMSQLVYDPETKKLYWRRSFTDARSNFTPDNEFRDKTYAVFALVDDYQAEDQLSDDLRQDLATVVGPLRANQIMPTPSMAANAATRLLDTIPQLTGSDLKPQADKLLPWAKALQQQLYTEPNSGTQSGLVALLRRFASPDAAAALGDSIEKWRAASLQVTTNGFLTLQK